MDFLLVKQETHVSKVIIRIEKKFADTQQGGWTINPKDNNKSPLTISQEGSGRVVKTFGCRCNTARLAWVRHFPPDPNLLFQV